MFNGQIFTETQINQMFSRPIAVRLKCLTGDGQAIFDEFKHKGQSFIGGYDHTRKLFYILNADAARSPELLPQSKGTIITIRTKQEKNRPTRRLETLHTR